MPGEPKRRHSKARKRTRRASIFLAATALVVCKNCGQKTLPHIVCKNCGMIDDIFDQRFNEYIKKNLELKDFNIECIGIFIKGKCRRCQNDKK